MPPKVSNWKCAKVALYKGDDLCRAPCNWYGGWYKQINSKLLYLLSQSLCNQSTWNFEEIICTVSTLS